MSDADDAALHAWTIKLLWVSGHDRIRGNEIAGDLAKKDAERTEVGPEPIFEISQQHVKVWIERMYSRSILADGEGCEWVSDCIEGQDPGQ